MNESTKGNAANATCAQRHDIDSSALTSPSSPWSQCMIDAATTTTDPTDAGPTVSGVTTQQNHCEQDTPKASTNDHLVSLAEVVTVPRKRCTSVTFVEDATAATPATGATCSLTNFGESQAEGEGCVDNASASTDTPIVPKTSNISVKSSSSSVCRICQLSEKETGEGLHNTGCHCRGTISRCHTECLWEWVRNRGSPACEVCNQLFSSLTPDQVTELSNIRAQRHQQMAMGGFGTVGPPEFIFEPRPLCMDNRRIWFCVVFVLLVFTICSTASLTVYLKEDYTNRWNEAWENGEGLDDTVSQNYVFCYTLVIAILSFSVTMAIGVFMSWVMAECFFWPRERRRRSDLQLLAELQMMQPPPSPPDLNNNMMENPAFDMSAAT